MKRQDLRAQHLFSITAKAGHNQRRTIAVSTPLVQRNRSVPLHTGRAFTLAPAH